MPGLLAVFVNKKIKINKNLRRVTVITVEVVFLVAL